MERNSSAECPSKRRSCVVPPARSKASPIGSLLKRACVRSDDREEPVGSRNNATHKGLADPSLRPIRGPGMPAYRCTRHASHDRVVRTSPANNTRAFCCVGRRVIDSGTSAYKKATLRLRGKPNGSQDAAARLSSIESNQRARAKLKVQRRKEASRRTYFLEA